MKRSIANSLQSQEDDLSRRRYESKKKREESKSKRVNSTKMSFGKNGPPQRGKAFGSFNSMSTDLDDPGSKMIESLMLDCLDDD